MVEYGKPVTEDLDEKKGGQNWIAIGGAALTLIVLLATCKQFSSTQKPSPSNGGSVSEQGKDDLVALKCTVSGTEKTFYPDRLAEKAMSKEDIFIFDAKRNKLMYGDHLPIEAKIDDANIIVERKTEDINAIDKRGYTDEYYYRINRESLAAAHTNESVSNMADIKSSTYILAEGSCQKIAVPKKKVVKRNNQI